MKSSLSILVAASTLALSACGGGSDSSTPSGTTVTISSTNQSDVARASVNGALAVSLAQGAIGGSANTSSVATRSHALGLVLQRALRDANNQRKGIASVSAHPAAVNSNVTDCSVSGTLTISVDDKDSNNQLSSGDVVTGTFAQCVEAETLSFSGTTVITLTSTPTDTQFAASVQFQGLAVQDGGVTSTITGTASVAETDTTTLTENTITVGSGGLSVAVASSGYNDVVAFDPGMAISTTVIGSNTTFSLTVAGSFTAQSIGGRVTLTTPVALSQGFDNLYPGSGQVRITGASGSTLLATVQSTTQVQLQLDANGDGTYESTTVVPWTTLVP